MVEGQELYAVVPPDETTSITIYASGVNEWGEYVDDTSIPLGENWPGEPLLLQCNLSEIYSNVLVVVNDGSETITFRPSLSMEDGHLVEIPGVYDFCHRKAAAVGGGRRRHAAGDEADVYRGGAAGRRL